MKQYQQIMEKITSSIISKDYNALSDSLDQAYNTCPRSGKYKSAICFGYQHLAKHSGLDDPEEAVVAFDRARQMYSDNRELMSDEAEYFNSYINTYGKELSSLDLDLFNKTIALIISCTPKSAQLKAHKAFDSVLDNIQKKLSKMNLNSDEAPIIAQELLKYIMHDLLDNSEYDILKETVYNCNNCKINYSDRINDINSNGTLLFASKRTNRFCPECGSRHEKLLSVKSFAELIDCSHETIKKWVQKRILRSFKLGGLVRIPISEVDRIGTFFPSIND